jgi:hypothetical protein
MTMEDVLSRVWENLIGRAGGPLTLRLLIQPTVATVLAITPYLLIRGPVTRIVRGSSPGPARL